MLRHCLACTLMAASAAAADEAAADDLRESRDEAWWTGPLLAPSPATLPQGHALVEPYLFDEISSGPTAHDLGSLTYMLYGVTDRVTAGLIPRFGYNQPSGAPSSSGVGFGDLTLQAGYSLTQYQDGRPTPAISVVVQETLPTGRYDRLTRASDGFGAGAYTTAVAVYSQDYFWMPNGRILRGRLDLTYAFSSSLSVQGLSVYGTADGFSGRAYPGDSFTADAAAEYSVTRNWVLALDVVYQHNDSTSVSGSLPGSPAPPGAVTAAGMAYESDSGSSWSIGLAPAVEYNFSSSIGVIFGVRVIEIGRNVTESVTPAVAVNMVF
jgi:Putative MetA-pathway of phenol degradation